jgi:hypothetical protein
MHSDFANYRNRFYSSSDRQLVPGAYVLEQRLSGPAILERARVIGFLQRTVLIGLNRQIVGITPIRVSRN